MAEGDFEWDALKAEANVRKHKISFNQARRVFDGLFALIELDESEDYGEDRYLATGMIDRIVVCVAYTERGERIRIISARKANSDEQRRYHSSQKAP